MGDAESRAWARLLKMLAHPTRLMILRELLNGVRCVNDMTEILDVRQPNLSQHLMLLREHGLVGSYRDGTYRCYYLTKPTLVAGLVDLLARDHPTAAPRREAAVRSASRRRNRAGTSDAPAGRSR